MDVFCFVLAELYLELYIELYVEGSKKYTFMCVYTYVCLILCFNSPIIKLGASLGTVG